MTQKVRLCVIMFASVLIGYGLPYPIKTSVSCYAGAFKPSDLRYASAH